LPEPEGDKSERDKAIIRLLRLFMDGLERIKEVRKILPEILSIIS